jgi:hypothetical protein
MSPREIEFENRLDVFGSDARGCAAFAYTELTFRRLLDTDRELARQLDANRAFWRTMRVALRTALSAALSRVYDETRNSNSAGQFLRFVEHHLELFSVPSLIARRSAAGTWRESSSHRVAAFEPRPGDLARLFAELDRQRRFYRRIVQPVRPRTLESLGTAESMSEPAAEELYGPEFGAFAVFPLRLHRALQGLYHEGRAPVLEEAPTSLEAVLAGGGPPQLGCWEHERAARTAAAFIQSQRSGGPALEPAVVAAPVAERSAS